MELLYILNMSGLRVVWSLGDLYFCNSWWFFFKSWRAFLGFEKVQFDITVRCRFYIFHVKKEQALTVLKVRQSRKQIMMSSTKNFIFAKNKAVKVLVKKEGRYWGYENVLDTFQDFLIAEHMKPRMYILEISISSLNHVILKPTKTPKLADKKYAQFY